MNGIKLTIYTTTLITSHTVFGMQYHLNHGSNISRTEAQGTILVQRYLNEEDQKQFFAILYSIKDKNLGKSDPTPFSYIEKAMKIKNEKQTNYIRKRRRTV